jgi:hypothetical protein
MLLNYDMLTLDQQQSYIKLRNALKPPRSTANQVTRNGILAAATVATYGANLLWAIPRRLLIAYYRNRPVNDLVEFLRGQIALHDCEGLQLNPPGFPALPWQVTSRFGDGKAHSSPIRRPAMKNEKPQRCPSCRKGVLTLFSANNNQKTYQCSNSRCPNPVLQIQRSDLGFKIIAAGSTAVIAGAALATYMKSRHPNPPEAPGLDTSTGGGTDQILDPSVTDLTDLPSFSDLSDMDWSSIDLNFGDLGDLGDWLLSITDAMG